MQPTIKQINDYIISDLEFHLEKPVIINLNLNFLTKDTDERFNHVYVYEIGNTLFVEKDFKENAVAEIEYDTELDQIIIRGYTEEFFAATNSTTNTDELPFWAIFSWHTFGVSIFFMWDASIITFLSYFFWFRITFWFSFTWNRSDTHVFHNLCFIFTNELFSQAYPFQVEPDPIG